MGKILSRIIFKRINLSIADNVLPESQCVFRSGRGTVSMIFTIRQLQEKCQKQRKDLFQVFIDLTKAFDTVNREALWLILRKLGCPEKLISILKLFHHDMKTTLNIGGKLAEPFTVGNGVKQGDTLAPTLFALYFSMVFQLAFKDSSESVYQTTGKLFNIKCFTARTKTMMSVIRELLYADDCVLLTHTETEMQHLMNSFETALELTISLKKTVLMYQPTFGKTYVEPSIYVYGQKLVVVPKFVYLGSILNCSNSFDDELCSRISKASHAFGILHKRLWSRHGISKHTKVKVYNACVLTVVLYFS